MLLAVADGVKRRFPEALIRAFSPYPEQDRQRQISEEIVDFAPSDMLLRVLPAALLSVLSRRRWRPNHGIAGDLAGADIAVDVSGIAFMDGRGGPTLVYNMLLVLLPWAFGVPVVKVAQALGPFNQITNRLAARLTLPRVSWIGLRGSQTERNVARLKLSNTEPAADVAFLLQVDPASEGAAVAELPTSGRVTLVAPSAVLDEQCRASGIDYVERLSALVESLASDGHEVTLIAHSAREGAKAGHTNDLPVCRSVAMRSSAHLIDREIDARELRALIGRARLLVTSRFHAMVSGLATGTPTFVLGWSHKYDEVLVEFGLDGWSADIREVGDDDLLQAIRSLDRSSEDVRSTINGRLPSVRRRAERNLVPVLKILAESR